LDSEPTIIVPNAFKILRGNHIEGELSSIGQSDDDYLVFNAGITLNPSEPPVWIEFSATVPNQNPSSMVFAIETRASTPNILQTIELFNFDVGVYEVVDTRMITMTDSVAEYQVIGDPSRFIESDINQVRARIGWKANGIVFLFPWSISIDHCSWSVAN